MKLEEAVGSRVECVFACDAIVSKALIGRANENLHEKQLTSAAIDSHSRTK